MTEETDLSKIKAGDHIEVRVCGLDAVLLNGGEYITVSRKQITKYIPAPFNWKDVKPGMAFTQMNSKDIYRYIGRAYNGDVVMQDSTHDEFISFVPTNNYLFRTPKHDLEENNDG